MTAMATAIMLAFGISLNVVAGNQLDWYEHQPVVTTKECDFTEEGVAAFNETVLAPEAVPVYHANPTSDFPSSVKQYKTCDPSGNGWQTAAVDHSSE